MISLHLILLFLLFCTIVRVTIHYGRRYKQLLNETNSPKKDSDLQAEKFGGDTPSQQGSGTSTVLDNASGQTNPNIIY
ncbi:unnamed protein product [Rotaria sordida]|uniref:Uncharacterized protein n=1 Tax=Rotaria sordida TaxID=392033 RepID=A0A813QP42_9BILA|nr:unnamed protein product [Rotaria sordida]